MKYQGFPGIERTYAGYPKERSRRCNHYTDVDTMMKIVYSCCLWATSIKYLNDVKEYEHFRGSNSEEHSEIY